MIKKLSVFAVVLCLFATGSSFAETKVKVHPIENGKAVVDLFPRADARQRVLVLTPEKARAAVILFAGGAGNIGIRKDGTIKRGGNFLVRSRARFAGQGFVTAVFDVPSDHRSLRDNRDSDWHVTDVAAVAGYLKKTYGLPVWLIGTSRGTMTVSYVGAKLTKRIAGVVFTASMDDAIHNPIEEITVPAFVTHHKNDVCHVTAPSTAKDIAERLKKSPKVEWELFSGGDEGYADCGPNSHHGFLGIEDRVVARIAKFIRENGAK